MCATILCEKDNKQPQNTRKTTKKMYEYMPTITLRYMCTMKVNKMQKLQAP